MNKRMTIIATVILVLVIGGFVLYPYFIRKGCMREASVIPISRSMSAEEQQKWIEMMYKICITKFGLKE